MFKNYTLVNSLKLTWSKFQSFISNRSQGIAGEKKNVPDGSMDGQIQINGLLFSLLRSSQIILKVNFAKVISPIIICIRFEHLFITHTRFIHYIMIGEKRMFEQTFTLVIKEQEISVPLLIVAGRRTRLVTLLSAE